LLHISLQPFSKLAYSLVVERISTAASAVTLRKPFSAKGGKAMWKTVILAGMGIFLALANGANGDEGGLRLRKPDGPFKKITNVEIQGTLRKKVETIYIGPRPMKDKRFPMPTIDFIDVTRWEVTVNGKTYELELNTKELQALAEKLAGKTVFLEGRLETRWRERHRPPMGPNDIQLMIAYMPMPVSVVVVNRLQNAEFVKETVTVVISGKLNMKARFGYPAPDFQAVITSGGKTYVLDFGNNAGLRLAGQLFDGKTVAVKGAFAGFYTERTMCMPTQTQLPIIRIDSLELGSGEFFHQTISVQIKGKLEQLNPWMGGRSHQDEPEFRITVDGKTYGLEFADKQALRNLASGLNGTTVFLTGNLQLRRTFAGTVWQMVVVQNLQAAGDFVRQTESFDFCCPLVPVR
jgi:hypothetical protein